PVREAVPGRSTALRSTSRTGGDEFALILPGVDSRGAEQVIEQVHELLALNNQFNPGQPLSLSMGHATSSEGERLEALVHRADQRMYDSKRRHYAHQQNDRRQR
ncbi:MAG: diguanylate cyclase, partial [Sphingobium sp.]